MIVITIGRTSEGNDVVINDPMVSRHHLQIIQNDDGSFHLADFGSTNGTYINGQKVNGEVNLEENDVVRIGSTTIYWHQYFVSKTPVEKQRHGFVTFWLWLGIIVNVISIPLTIILYQRMSNLGYLGMQLIAAGIDIDPFSKAIGSHVLIMQIVAAIAGIALIVGYSLILKWKKSGFWLAVVVAVIVAVVNVIMFNLIKNDYLSIGLLLDFNPIVQLIATPISLIILWAVLQIKKNGVSCWKQLK